MSRFEKPMKFVSDMTEINNEAMIKLAELSAENFKKYLELNQSFVSKLPEVSDISSFVELQREYGQNLWEGVQEDLRAHGTIVRDAVEHTGSLVRGAFNSDDGVTVTAEVKAA